MSLLSRSRLHAHSKSQGLGVAHHIPLGSRMWEKWFPKREVGHCLQKRKGCKEVESSMSQEAPGSPMVRTLFSLPRAQVQNLVGELRSHKPGSAANPPPPTPQKATDLYYLLCRNLKVYIFPYTVTEYSSRCDIHSHSKPWLRPPILLLRDTTTWRNLKANGILLLVQVSAHIPFIQDA